MNFLQFLCSIFLLVNVWMSELAETVHFKKNSLYYGKFTFRGVCVFEQKDVKLLVGKKHDLKPANTQVRRCPLRTYAVSGEFKPKICNTPL